LNYLLRYSREQETIFLQQLSLIRQLPGKKDVHELRVAYKKWRTVLRFAADEFKLNQLVQELVSIRIIFRVAGIYRDAEMSDSLLKQYSQKEKCSLPSFQQYLRGLKSIGRAQTKAVANIEINSNLHLVHQDLSPSLNSISENELNNLIQIDAGRKWESCMSMKDHFSKQAHPIRKTLKQVYYLLMLCPVNTLFDAGQMKELDSILNALGHWHDHEILYDRLRYFRKNMLVKGLEEYEQAMKLEAVLKLERDGWLGKAEVGLKEILLK
jgi:CHAD domain-containing protein